MRSPVQLRTARHSDAPALVDIWSEVMRKAGRELQLDDIRRILDRVSVAPEERIVVAEVGDNVVGAVHLRASTCSPVNLERVVQVSSPGVLPTHRRRGIGSALMQAAAEFAEELAVPHIGVAVAAGARDSNRFMARLGLGPAATLRLAATATVKGRLLASRRPTLARGGARQLTHVLAARRSLRRHQPTGG
jgi:ribosomal protein S18 acetylase RimI-like enzyme